MSNLNIENLSFSYDGKTEIIRNLSWTIERNHFYSIVGRSGCGKTSLLHLIFGLDKPTSGAVIYNNKKITNPLEDAGIVFQRPTLLEWKTVRDNVLLPISLKRKCTKEDINWAKALLKRMKIEQYEHSFPDELSGGQQSRVAIARALIKKPSFLFLDEPFAALDALTREELQIDLLELCHAHQMTTIFITHDLTEAVFLSDEVAVMEQGKMIHKELISLGEERTISMRYSDSFNEHCLTLRRALESGVVQ